MSSQEKFLSGPLVDARYGISAMTRWRWQRDSRLGFPIPISINGRRMWRVSDLEAWEDDRTFRPTLRTGAAHLKRGSQHLVEHSSPLKQPKSVSRHNKAERPESVVKTTCQSTFHLRYSSFPEC